MPTLTLELPAAVEADLRAEGTDPAVAAREALLVSRYRGGRLSQAALAEALDVDRPGVEAVLRRHGVVEDMGTLDDYLDDAESLRRLPVGGK